LIRIEKSQSSGNWTVIFRTEDTSILLSSDKTINLALIEAAKRLSIVAIITKKESKFEAICGVLKIRAVGETPTLARDRLKMAVKRELEHLPLMS